MMEHIRAPFTPVDLDPARHDATVVRGGTADTPASIDLTRTQVVRLKQAFLQWLGDNDSFIASPEPHFARKVSIAGQLITLHVDSAPTTGSNILFWPGITRSGDSYTIASDNVAHDKIEIADDAVRCHPIGAVEIGGSPHSLSVVFEGEGSHRASMQDAVIRINLSDAISRTRQQSKAPSFARRVISALGF